VEEFLPDETHVNELISIHANRLNNRYNRIMHYYLGKHSIIRKLAKAKGKPDHRLVINFAKELVDNEVGFFAGTPVKFDYDDNGNGNNELDQRIADFVAINDLTDTIAEFAKQVDIFGRSYTLLYQDEDSNTRVAPIDHAMLLLCMAHKLVHPLNMPRITHSDNVMAQSMAHCIRNIQ